MIQSDEPLKITGNHLQGMSDEDVEGFLMRSQELFQIPEGFGTFFPNLKGFYIRDSKVKTISKHDLQFQSLLYFYLAFNELEILDGDLFEFTPKLQDLYLQSNLIRHVGPNLLSSLDYLREAWFGSNQCIHRNAYNRQEVLELMTELVELCPPAETTTAVTSTTTESNEFCEKCEGHTIAIVEKFEARIGELIEAHDARIVQLENQIKELCRY